MKFNKKRKGDYYSGAISFLALRALISSWSTTWNSRKGKFSDEFIPNWTIIKRINRSHHIIGDGNEVEAQWDPTLGRKILAKRHKHELEMGHTHIYIHFW